MKQSKRPICLLCVASLAGWTTDHNCTGYRLLSPPGDWKNLPIVVDVCANAEWRLKVNVDFSGS